MSPAEELRQRLGLQFDPEADAFGFPWSSWERIPAKASAMSIAQAVEATRTVRQRTVDPRQSELFV